MKILEREFHQLKNGKLFVMFTVQGKSGEELDLSKEGIKSKLLFFHETPKSMCDCSYCEEENKIELGGLEKETDRTLYFVVDNTFKKECGGGCSGE